MRTLVGSAEPEPRPAPPFTINASSTTTGATASFVVVSSTQPTFDQSPIPLRDPREPYRTQAYVDRRQQIEAGPNGVTEGES